MRKISAKTYEELKAKRGTVPTCQNGCHSWLAECDPTPTGDIICEICHLAIPENLRDKYDKKE